MKCKHNWTHAGVMGSWWVKWCKNCGMLKLGNVGKWKYVKHRTSKKGKV